MSDRLLEFDVAVIGAGMAGLTCAERLRQLGYTVVVLEKSRGVSGRVTTRRFYGLRADRGARCLDPSATLSQQLVRVLSQQGIVEPWTDTVYRLQASDGQISPQPHWCPYYAAPTGMNAVGKFLARHLQVWLNRRAESLTPRGDRTWHVQLKATGEEANPFLTQGRPVEVSTPEEVTAKAVVVAIPATQAVTLLDSPDKGISDRFLYNLRSVQFDPCISTIAVYPASRQAQFAQRAVQWRSLVVSQDPYLSWIGWDSSKRQGSSPPVVVFHSTPEFARQYWSAKDLEPAARQLLDRTAELGLPELRDPEAFQVDLWRYAFCQRPWIKPVLSTAQPLPLVCAGDWCGTAQIETALHSGLEAASWVNRQFEQFPLPPLASFWEILAAVP